VIVHRKIDPWHGPRHSQYLEPFQKRDSAMPLLFASNQRPFSDLTDREVLALAIQNEEEDGRLYRDFAEGLRNSYPASAKIFDEMATEESEHRRRLLDLFKE